MLTSRTRGSWDN